MNFPRRSKRGILVCVTALAVFVFDLLIKTYLRFNFAYQSLAIIKNVLHITVVFNKGAAFGILQGKTTLLIYIAVIFILFFLIFTQRESKKGAIFSLSCGLILGGALSNLFDRIFLGYVVDYIDIRIWPVFNLSDACITTGVFLLFLTSTKRFNFHR